MLIGYLQKRDAPAGFIAAASSSRFSVTPEQRERIRAALAPPDPAEPQATTRTGTPLIMLAGLYHAVSFVANATGVQHEAFAPRFPPPAITEDARNGD